MKRFFTLIVFVALALAAVPASADVTIKMSMATNAGPMVMEISTTTSIKGTKMRTDMSVMGQDTSLIVDLATKEMLQVNHGAKTVETFNPSAAAAALPMSFGEATVSIKPMAETKEILGRKCAGFTMQMSIPMSMNGETITMTMEGPVWIAKEGPGTAEYQAFYKASAASGLVASPLMGGPQGTAMAEMQKSFAENGIPLEQNMAMAMTGSGEVAQAMAQMGGNMSVVMKVSSITTDPIPDSTFAVPAGYTKK
jgi:hypothetical protein